MTMIRAMCSVDKYLNTELSNRFILANDNVSLLPQKKLRWCGHVPRTDESQ